MATMDWQLTCRVCLESGDMVSLFDWDENNEQLCEKYTFCCGVEIKKTDTLPTLICLSCVDKLTFSYQFKQQCLTSNDTLKECLEEFKKSSAAVSANSSKEMETITIKQENGMLLQYDLPVEHDPHGQWSRSLVKTAASTVVTKSPGPRKRGRPRKYLNYQGGIAISPYNRKKPKRSVNEPESLTSLLANGKLEQELKEEPADIDEEPFDGDDFLKDDPDFVPEPEAELDEPKDGEIQQSPKKRGRPRKTPKEPKPKPKEDDGEDVLLKETILAFSEPIPEHILNPKPKKKYVQQKKKYVYEKTHTCETCGSSFTSNASLQAHIRRHLGIKPFVCSVCGFACVMKEALKRHMLRHTGERPYKCRICDRRFGDYGTRQKHERLHMGIRPYQCSLCGKSFTYSYVLANHMLTHTGEKKYSCGPCNKKFTKAHHLKYHNKVHHKELYIQQQLEMEAKKEQRQINVSGLSGVISGQIVDGTLQFIQTNSEEGDQDNQMQVVEDHQDDDVKETDRAVAGMQGVVLDEDFCISTNDDDK